MNRALAASVLLLSLACRENPRTAAPALPAERVGRTPVRLMPLGDSITQADAEHDSYRRPLWQLLAAQGHSVDFVGSQSGNQGGGSPHDDFDRDHEGHWGWRADEVLARIGRWAEEARADVVLIHLGSNDVFQNQSPASTIDELGQIIDRLRAVNPAVRILLAQLIPVADPGQHQRIERLNPEIAHLAEGKTTASSPVLLVDQFKGFDVADDTYDGVHPDLSGEVKMAERWFSALEGLPLSR